MKSRKFTCGRRRWIIGEIAWLTALLPIFVMAETGKLTVRVRDAESNQLLPARLVLRAADGTYPGDRLDCHAGRWPHFEAHGIFIRGEQTFELPAGKTSITAAHGLSYGSVSQSIDLQAARPAVIELKLPRIVDLKRKGWVSGDLHVHMVHGENQRQTSYDDVAVTCAANGLDFVCVGQEYVGAGELNLEGYHAACAGASTADFRMFLGGECPKSLLGHQVLMGVSNPFLIDENPPYYQSARKVHAQGGVLVYVHPVRYYPGKQYQNQWLDFPGNNLARELVFDTYLGPSFDGLSVLSDEPADQNAWGLWFQLLNRGHFVPVFADSDACFDRPVLGFKVPGFWSTYFHIGADTAITEAALTEAVRQGRTFATTGPLLQFRIDRHISGGTLPLDGKPHTVEIEAWYPQHAFSLEQTDPRTNQPVGISKVELIRNGKVVHTWEPNQPHVTLTHSISETEACWYVVRVLGTDQRWQVGVASPIYFAANPVPAKRQPMPVAVRGRIYDFHTGVERHGTVEIRRDGRLLKSFPANGQFRVTLPLDAEVVVQIAGENPMRRNLLLDHGPVHRFLWYLEAKDLARSETFDLFEHLVREIDLEFPVGHKLAGSYIIDNSVPAGEMTSVKVLGGPARPASGNIAIAAICMDVEQIAAGDQLQVLAIFRDEGQASKVGPLVVEGRGYDPRRPTAYGALKKFAEFETTWTRAGDLGDGYKFLSGKLVVPTWVEAGPTGGIDISVRARQGHGDAAWIGLKVPLGPTRRALSVTSAWRTMPVSWPDGHYGIGPFLACNRIGRAAQSQGDYRQVHFEFQQAGKVYDVWPARDGRGCPDADDAVYISQFLDQSLAEQSQSGQPDPVRAQPVVNWRADLPLIDASE